MRFLWSLLIGLVVVGFAWYSSLQDEGHWLISIPIVFLMGDLLQWQKSKS